MADRNSTDCRVHEGEEEEGGDDEEDDGGGIEKKVMMHHSSSTIATFPAQNPSGLTLTTHPHRPSRAIVDSRSYTNKISLILFLVHLVLIIGLVCFLMFKEIQGAIMSSNSSKRKEKRLIHFYVTQVEASCLASIALSIVWQKALIKRPKFMIHFILWSSSLATLSTGILLICSQRLPMSILGSLFVTFAIGNGLYGLWISRRIGFCSQALSNSFKPISKFTDMNRPIYLMLSLGFIWVSLWILALVGALDFYFQPLIITLLVLSLAWMVEVMRNVANLTLSRLMALYYLQETQSNTQICFQRAITSSLGSACLGSLFVPTIEALRILAKCLNLVEGQDEFMFCCAHCCLRIMKTIFKNSNNWAFVHVAMYGKDFVKASRDTWELFERQEMEVIVNYDITTSICFLYGVCNGSLCLILVAALSTTLHQPFTATLSLISFFIGYLMVRIGMVPTHACAGCYYVCYAENPENKLFDRTIKDQMDLIRSGRDVLVPTALNPPRFGV